MQTMFQPQHGDRVNSPNFGIILTDGESNDRMETFQQAVATRKQGIHLMSIGMNMRSMRGKKELLAISNDPDEANVFNVDTFEGLYNITDSLLQAICNSE